MTPDPLAARVHALIAQVPMPTHFNHRAFSDRDGHTWQSSDVVIDTAPPIYHRWCETCGMVQQRTEDESDWSDDLDDTLRGYRQRILDALEAALAAAPVEAAEEKSGCPCLYTTPCHPRCTCVKWMSSRGCLRCCRYGSLDQQRRMAEYLAAALAVAPLPEPTDRALLIALKQTERYAVILCQIRHLIGNEHLSFDELPAALAAALAPNAEKDT